jgi:ABC-type phosphate transport system permease subunit
MYYTTKTYIKMQKPSKKKKEERKTNDDVVNMKKRKKRRHKQSLFLQIYIHTSYLSFFFYLLSYYFSMLHCLLQCFPHGNKDKDKYTKTKWKQKRHWKKHLLFFFFCLSSTMSCINYITSFSFSIFFFSYLREIYLSWI